MKHLKTSEAFDFWENLSFEQINQILTSFVEKTEPKLKGQIEFEVRYGSLWYMRVWNKDLKISSPFVEIRMSNGKVEFYSFETTIANDGNLMGLTILDFLDKHWSELQRLYKKLTSNQ